MYLNASHTSALQQPHVHSRDPTLQPTLQPRFTLGWGVRELGDERRELKAKALHAGIKGTDVRHGASAQCWQRTSEGRARESLELLLQL